MLGFNPLTGPNDDDVGPRFPSLRDAYDLELRARAAGHAARSASRCRGRLPRRPGPSFETPAEIRAFRTLGADAVGMSTVPRSILARHCGLRVAAVARSRTSPRAWAARSSRTSRRCATRSGALRRSSSAVEHSP
jgi:xanthosine phosphorylase